MNKIVSNEELRLRITEYAEEVQRTGNPLGVNLVGGRPRYQLMPEAAVDPSRAQRCVRVGPDRFRRDFGDIRVLTFYDDMAFGGDAITISFPFSISTRTLPFSPAFRAARIARATSRSRKWTRPLVIKYRFDAWVDAYGRRS